MINDLLKACQESAERSTTAKRRLGMLAKAWEGVALKTGYFQEHMKAGEDDLLIRRSIRSAIQVSSDLSQTRLILSPHDIAAFSHHPLGDQIHASDREKIRRGHHEDKPD